MIEVQGLDRRGTLAGAETVLAVVMRAEADQLALAAHWADLHSPASVPVPATAAEGQRRRWDGDYGVPLGGDGTPEVLARCLAELGLVLQTSAGGAKHLVADALDLRHRLPRVWTEVQAGRVRGWKARKVAQSTRHLPRAVMAEVDAGLAGLLPSLPWSRFEAVLDATVLRADPVGAAHAEADAASRRFVGLARDTGYGLKTLIARGEVLDIVTFLAAVNRVADLLAADGDPDTVEVRRSKAVGILGQPDRALALLTAHRDDPDQPPPPTEPRSQGGWHRPHVTDNPEPEDTDEPDDDGPDDDGLDDAGPDDAGLDSTDSGHGEKQAPDGPDQADGSDPQDDGLGDGPPPEADEPGRRSLDLTPAGRAGRTGGAASVRVQLYVHLTDAALNGSDPAAVCRVEGVGPVTAHTVRGWLRRPDAAVTVRPVTVPGQAVPVDSYEIPTSVREAVRLRNPASVFPWSGCTDRHALQLDHTRPYLVTSRGGPPGQTDPDNLAPLAGPEHQHKTFRHWQTHTLAAGAYLWRSPHGWITLVTNQGTFPLGATTTAHQVWHAAIPPPLRSERVA